MREGPVVSVSQPTHLVEAHTEYACKEKKQIKAVPNSQAAARVLRPCPRCCLYKQSLARTPGKTKAPPGCCCSRINIKPPPGCSRLHARKNTQERRQAAALPISVNTCSDDDGANDSKHRRQRSSAGLPHAQPCHGEKMKSAKRPLLVVKPPMSSTAPLRTRLLRQYEFV
jgi:hypothetical protein